MHTTGFCGSCIAQSHTCEVGAIYAGIVLLICASETAFWQCVHLSVYCAPSVTPISYSALKLFWDYFVNCIRLVISLDWETSSEFILNIRFTKDQYLFLIFFFFFLSWVWTYHVACETLQSNWLWKKVDVAWVLFKYLSGCAWLVVVRSISACPYVMVNNEG